MALTFTLTLTLTLAVAMAFAGCELITQVDGDRLPAPADASLTDVPSAGDAPSPVDAGADDAGDDGLSTDSPD